MAQGLWVISAIIKSESKSDSQVCSCYHREPSWSQSWWRVRRGVTLHLSSCISAAMDLGLCRSRSRCIYCIVTFWMSLPWSLSHSGALSSNGRYTETEMKKTEFERAIWSSFCQMPKKKNSTTAATDQYLWIEVSFLF